MSTSLLVIDDFWPNPDALCAEASSMAFSKGRKNAPTLGSKKKSRFYKKLTKKIENILGEEVSWAATEENGMYRKITESAVKKTKSDLLVHSDLMFNVVSILYLSPEQLCQGGTGLFRHKQTGLFGFHDQNAIIGALQRHKMSVRDLSYLILTDGKDPNKWEMTDFVQMRFNRLIIINGALFHSHVFDFKKVPKNTERLTLVTSGTTRSHLRKSVGRTKNSS